MQKVFLCDTFLVQYQVSVLFFLCRTPVIQEGEKVYFFMESNGKKSGETLTGQYEQEKFKKFLKFIKPYYPLILMAVCSTIVMNVIGATMPWMLKIAIDQVIPNADYVLFWVVAVVMVLLFMVRGLLRYISAFLMGYVGVRIMIGLRQKIFRHLHNLSLRFHEEVHTGKLISNVTNDVNLLSTTQSAIAQFLEQFVLMLLLFAMMFYISWQMAIMVGLTLPLHYFNYRFFRKELQKDTKHLAEVYSEMSSVLSETLHGVKVVKAFGKGAAEGLNFFNAMRPQLYYQMRVATENSNLWTVYDFLALLTHLATVGMGVFLVQSNTLTIGEFVAFYGYIAMLLAPLNILSNMSSVFAGGMVGAGRIMSLLEAIPEIQEAPHPVRVDRLKGEIEFKNVCFAYDQEKEQTISDFSLTISPGQKVALVGASGSGKTTISNLLLRFYDVNSGGIKVDGIDIRRFAIESYRNNCGVVLQDPFLFSGTIRENIAYAKKNATQEDIEKAAEMANVTEFVNDLPLGFDTVIGENGTSLSGGQRQRIAIARAVLTDPSILILDEATSALDTVSEFLVQEALDNMMKDRTTIIIAHRLSTIKNADLIVVMDKGTVVQKGTHDELINIDGAYRELYRNQKKLADRA